MTRTATRTRPQPTPACVHHYVLEPPEGPVSRGRCKLCGSERDFRNGLVFAADIGHAWRHLRAETPGLTALKCWESSDGYSVPSGELRE